MLLPGESTSIQIFSYIYFWKKVVKLLLENENKTPQKTYYWVFNEAIIGTRTNR